MATLDVGPLSTQPPVHHGDESSETEKSEFAVMSLLNEFVIEVAYLVSKAYVKKLKFSSVGVLGVVCTHGGKIESPKIFHQQKVWSCIGSLHRRNFDRCVITSLEQVQSNLESKTVYLCCPIWLHRKFYKICDTQSCRSSSFEGVVVLNARHILPLSPTMC